MNRRNALANLSLGMTAGALAAARSASAQTQQPQTSPSPTVQTTVSNTKARLKLGCQERPSTAKRVELWQRFGVTHVCGCPENIKPQRGYWTVDELAQVRDLCASRGIECAMMWEPFLSSVHVDAVDRPAIMLGKSPDRDRDIECFQKHIANCAAAGIPAVKYNLSLLGVVRSGKTPGRGNTNYSTWRLADGKDIAAKTTKAGRVTADEYWERITYFLDRVVPVAEEHKVRLACHPQDPGLPQPFQGVDAVLSSVDGLKRFVAIRESPYHGLNFCQGTISEMLERPNEEIGDVIRYFGSRGKIFNVHFRNIRGRVGDFMEVYPDEGSVDMVRAMLAYKEVGYDGMLMYDHIPDVADNEEASRAFAYGYIRALIQAAEATSA